MARRENDVFPDEAEVVVEVDVVEDLHLRKPLMEIIFRLNLLNPFHQKAKIFSHQVTINVNKQNKIVRRKVESTDQKDRVGSADMNGEEPAPPRRQKRQQNQITFSIFIGGIPKNCR